MNETPFLQLIQKPFLAYSEHAYIILLLILLTYLVMALLGVHPVATIGVLLEVLSPLLEILNPLSIGIVLIVGALATSSSGTYGIMVTITSMNTKQNPYRITWSNLPFALLLGGVAVLIATCFYNVYSRLAAHRIQLTCYNKVKLSLVGPNRKVNQSGMYGGVLPIQN